MVRSYLIFLSFTTKYSRRVRNADPSVERTVAGYV